MGHDSGSGAVAIVTMTFARSRAEEDLLLRSLRAAARLELPMFIADRGGRPEFLAHLARLPRTCVVQPQEGGLVGQIKSSFAAAAAAAPSAFLYTEPDKELFFSGAASRLIDRARREEPALVLAARTPESYATFPAVQQYTESVVNHLCGEIVGVTGDFSYGPFLVPRGLLPRIASLPAQIGWGWRFATFRAAHLEGVPLVHVPEDLGCPHDQRREDEAERTHRLRQLSENVLGLIT